MPRVIDIEQGSEEWLAWRRDGVTATDLPVILGASPYATLQDIRDKKLGKETKVSAAMKRGSKYEPEAREWAESELKDKFPSVCLECSRNSVFRASLDGFNGTEVLEIKVPQKRNFETFFDNRDNMEMYSWQVQWQMYVAGVENGWLLCYCPSLKHGKYVPIGLNRRDKDRMVGAAQRFWDAYQLGVPLS